MSNEKKRVGTTETSLSILEEIQEHGTMTSSDIVERLDLAKSTVHRHLNTLNDWGYLTKEGNRYALSMKFLHFGMHTRNRKEEYRLVRKYVSEMATITNEEVDFAVFEGERMYILFNDRPGEEIPNDQVGQQYSVHNTAAGKAILAELPDTRVTELIDRLNLYEDPARGDPTSENLITEIEVVRERGYGINDEETVEGKRAISKAITYPNGIPIGALTISGPKYRVTNELIEDELIGVLSKKIAEIEDEITAKYEGD